MSSQTNKPNRTEPARPVSPNVQTKPNYESSDGSDSEVEKMSSDKAASRNPSTPAKAVMWDDVSPKFVGAENAMSPEQVKLAWTAMYNQAGVSGERQQASLRAAVYMYGLKNGTTRVGSYTGKMKLADGSVVEAAIIPRATGQEIRKFYRGCATESYEFFKLSKAVGSDPVILSRATQLGIPASAAFCMADWLGDCVEFTPAERQAYEKSFSESIRRSRAARGGFTLEKVETEASDARMRAQGETSEGPVAW